MDRGKYRRLLLYPAYGLFDGDRLVATARAATAEQARQLFKEHNERHPDWQLEGDRVKRLGHGKTSELERLAEQTRSPDYS